MTLPVNNNHNSHTVERSENTFNQQRAKENIELLKQFKAGKLHSLKAYTGFGGLRRAFRDDAVLQELRTFLSDDEIDKLSKSTSTGYFTPDMLIDFIYSAVQKLGFKGGKVLEPACGHGAFFDRMPKDLREKSQITGIELEPLSAAIAKNLHHDIKIVTGRFQHFHENDFDLIIGNPPYGRFPVFDKQHLDLSDEMIHHYFVAKSVRLLKEGGLLAMVVPCYILDNIKRHLRDQIAEHADLVAAFRLPENLFADAKITVDIIILQCKSSSSKNWHGTTQVTLNNEDKFFMADYFVKHPDHVLGDLSTYEAYSHFEERSRRGLRCVGNIGTVKERLTSFLKDLKPIL